ncbi:MAG: PrsW family glutamic-type intramembrane protease, partial [Bacteroidota bacterium]|nr:PrsW family glutamic-type intramembrane protease [Bacteroidota bacterium]
MNKLIKSSIYGSLIITLLYLVLFYPLILIHKFDWYDLLLVSLSISPGIFIMIVIYNLDSEDQEPLWLLALCFIFGAINLHIDVDILEYVFGFINMDNIFLQLGGEALTVAITEEMLKFLVVILIIYPNKAFDEPFDGIVYAVFVGMGFATAENLTFVLQGNTSVALFRMLSAIPAHFVFAVIMGYYLGIAKSRKKKEFFYISLSIITPIILHA